MLNVRRFLGFFLLGFVLTHGPASAAPRPVATLNLSEVFPSANRFSIAFAAEDRIAVSANPGADNSSFIGAIGIFEWRNGSLHLSASAHPDLDAPFPGQGLFAVAHGSVLFSHRPPRLFSSDLVSSTALPIRIPVAPAGQANVVAGYGRDSWDLYRVRPEVSLLRRGPGKILSVSDDFVVFRTDRELRIETLAGKPIGQFPIAPESACFTQAVLLGKNRLFLFSCNRYKVVDFGGKEITVIPAPDGWGSRCGTSLDGSRLLFDHFTRRIPVAQRLLESMEGLISLGMAPIYTDKGEVVRVVDTLTGKICFDLDSPDELFGSAGTYHADISPSGRFAAVVVTNAKGSTLSVYRVP